MTGHATCLLRSAMIIAILIVSLPLSLSHAQEIDVEISVCPTEELLTQQLAARLNNSQDTQHRLQLFISGEQQLGSHPAALFTIDINDEAAVQRRLAELRGFAAQPGTSLSSGAQTLLACTAGMPELETLAQQLRDTEQSIVELRLSFLSLPLERRNALLKAQTAAAQRQEEVSRLELERDAAERQKEQAGRSMEIAAELTKTARTADLRELAAQRTLLERSREELAGLKLQLTSDLATRTKESSVLAEKLSTLAGIYTQTDKPAQLEVAYAEVVQIWRELTDTVLTRIAASDQYIALPKLPAYPTALLDRLRNDNEAEAYRSSYTSLEHLHQEISTLRESRLAEERENIYSLLLVASRQRSQLLEANLAAGNSKPVALSGDYLRDVLRELRLVPYRWIALTYTKLLSFRYKLHSGLSGFIDILQQTSLFLVLVLVPFLMFRILHLSSNVINRFRQHLVQKQARAQKETRLMTMLAIALHRANIYLPWIMMLLALWVAGILLERTDLPELIQVLLYIEYYVWYRLLVQLIFNLMNTGLTTLGATKSISQRVRLYHSVRQIGLFFLAANIILHATENVVGEALVYRIVYAVMVYIGILVCAYAARKWRDEIVIGIDKILPDIIAVPLINLCSGRWALLYCLPALLLVFGALLLRRLRGWLGRFDITKHLAAELFRRKVESAVSKEKVKEQLPEEYLVLFDLNVPEDKGLLIEPSHNIAGELLRLIKSWAERDSDNSLAIYGHKGSGKSCLLSYLKNSGLQDWNVSFLTAPPKLCTAAGVRDFLQPYLQEPDTGAETNHSPDQTGRRIILLDDAQNLFLSRPGGFEGYREFLSIISSTSHTHFWCSVFNQFSWNYLNGVFGSGLGFRQAFEMSDMSEGDLRNLIMKRHGRSAYELAYDAIIRATQSPDDYDSTAQVEAQFFRLLWGQSKGNPRAALVLWLSALSLERDGRLHVSIPRFHRTKALEHLSDDGIFVYAAVIKHENLSLHEATAVTNLPELTVSNALHFGLEEQILAVDSVGRYRVTPTAQFSLSQFLVSRNYIYE